MKSNERISSDRCSRKLEIEKLRELELGDLDGAADQEVEGRVLEALLVVESIIVGVEVTSWKENTVTGEVE